MKHHGNYRRKSGKRSGRKPNWYIRLVLIRDNINKALAAFDKRPRQ